MTDLSNKTYRNMFAEIGISQEEIDRKLEEIVQTFFYGSEEERIYHPVGEDMGYLMDTGNNDARTEGMSYGMMMCVQLDMKEEFDRIWKWSKTYMYMTEGWNEGYFAWSCGTDGSRNADGPAPDGEEFYAMALFLLPIGGETGKGFSTTPSRPERFSGPACTRGRTAARAIPCGTGTITRSCLYRAVTIRILPIICPIFMNFSPYGRTRRTGLSGRKLPGSAGNIWPGPAIPSRA